MSKHVILCATEKEAQSWRGAGVSAVTVTQVKSGGLGGLVVAEYAVTELAREIRGIYDAVSELHHKTRGVAR